MTETLRFERHLAHPPEKVWRALTEPAHLSAWYPMQVVDLDLRAGGAIRFRDEEGTEFRGEVTEVNPPKHFAFREYDPETGEHDARFELAPDGEGCVLVFTHSFVPGDWAAQVETGWNRCLDALPAVLEAIA